MSEDNFLIHELAGRAGTTVRTIRYYTDEGLLPQPVIQGKYAYYTPAHVKRLELIRRMKDAYLPLREIREIMSSLSDEEVDARLSRPPQPVAREIADAPDPSLSRSGANALQYISRIMGEQAGHRSESPAPLSDRKEIPAPPVRSSIPASLPASAEDWRRIHLAPGVELHLREPADPATSRRIQQIIEFAQKLFQTIPGGK